MVLFVLEKSKEDAARRGEPENKAGSRLNVIDGMDKCLCMQATVHLQSKDV